MGGNFTLEDLLQESYDLVVSAANDTTVCNYLKNPPVLRQLVEHVLKEPVKRDDVSADQYPELQKQLLNSNTAGDTISQSLILLDAILQDKEILTTIFNGFKTYKSHVVFHRVTSLLMAFFSINATLVVEFIRDQQPDFLKSMVGQLGKAPSEDILNIFKMLIRPNVKAQGLGDWLITDQLVKLLINNLKPANVPQHQIDLTSRETVVVLQELLNEAITKSKLSDLEVDNFDEFDINFSSSEEDKPPKSPPVASPASSTPAPCQILLKQFEDPESIDLLLSSMVASPTALAYGVPFLIHLLNQTANSFSSLELKSVDCLDSFLNILKPPEEVSIVFSDKVQYDKKLGFNRLSIMKYLIVLLKLDHQGITNALFRKGSFKVALDVLYFYPENTVVQNLILEYFAIGFSRPTHVCEVVTTSDLTKRIVASWEQLKIQSAERLADEAVKEHAMTGLKKLFRRLRKEREIKVEVGLTLQILRGSKIWSYFGHLFKLANMVQNVNLENIDNNDIKEQWKTITQEESWKNFVEEVLKSYNTISNQKLDQAHDSDSDEF